MIVLGDWLYNTLSFEKTETMLNAVEQKLSIFIVLLPVLCCSVS